MANDVAYCRRLLASASQMLTANLQQVSLDEALYSGPGFRSSLGVLKHIGGWLSVYRSYAFDSEPRHWERTDWPRGLRETVDLWDDYLLEVTRWLEHCFATWDAALAALPDGGMAQESRPLHWGSSASLGEIVILVAQHVVFHTGELNMLLSMKRGEAWEWGEEVEENHIDTFGHGVRPGWMDDALAKEMETRLRLAHEARASDGI